jgi:hypothetical protein
MRRHRLTLVALGLVCVTLFSACGGGGTAAKPPAHDLTGTWTNSAGVGTTLVLTQQHATLTWVGGPNNKAWVQYFDGTVSGSAFSGTFVQDAPGVVPQRFRGKMEAQINDACHFTFTKIAQEGQKVVTNVVFTKATCASAQPAMTVAFAQGRFTPKVSSGARVTFCNDGTITNRLFTTGSGNAFKEPKVKPSACFTRRFVNSGKAPLLVTVRGGPRGGRAFLVIVEPAAS